MDKYKQINPKNIKEFRRKIEYTIECINKKECVDKEIVKTVLNEFLNKINTVLKEKLYEDKTNVIFQDIIKAKSDFITFLSCYDIHIEYKLRYRLSSICRLIKIIILNRLNVIYRK